MLENFNGDEVRQRKKKKSKTMAVGGRGAARTEGTEETVKRRSIGSKRGETEKEKHSLTAIRQRGKRIMEGILKRERTPFQGDIRLLQSKEGACPWNLSK